MDLHTVPKIDSHTIQQMVRVGVADNVQLAGEASDHGGSHAGDVRQHERDGGDDEQGGGQGVQGGDQEHHRQDVGDSDGPVDVTCHQGGDEPGGEGDGERVGDDVVAATAGRRRALWKVPKRRRGVIPDGMVQSRLNNFVDKFPNLGVRGGGENTKISSGAK